MLRPLHSLLSVVALAVPCVAAPPAHAADAPANPCRLTLPVGSSVAIPLPSNASTGYVWQLAEPLPRECPVSVSIEPETAATSRADPPLCGAPGVTLVRIAGLRKGSATLRLHYVRPWEQNRPAARAKTLAVTVE